MLGPERRYQRKQKLGRGHFAGRCLQCGERQFNICDMEKIALTAPPGWRTTIYAKQLLRSHKWNLRLDGSYNDGPAKEFLMQSVQNRR